MERRHARWLVVAPVCSLTIEGAIADVAEGNVRRALRPAREQPSAVECRQWARPVTLGATDGASFGWTRARGDGRL
ncbi:hypothetical protein A8H31_03515 [Burkholderia thailandensis]|nr:hypothetical protein A8H31_03515 [Burkholderia thailandensis]